MMQQQRTPCTQESTHSKTHSEGPAVAANDLLIENEKLQAKLEDQEAELTEALQQIMSSKAELEHFKNQYVSMEKALKQA